MRIFAFPLVVLAINSLVSSSAGYACIGPDTRAIPPIGATVVDANGLYAGSFRNISAAVTHLPNTTEQHTIFLFPGIYHEQVLISKLRGPLVLQGYTCNATSYAANEVTITHSKAQRDIPPEITSGRNDLTSTLRLKTNNVRVYNLNVANTAGKIENNGQAVATIIEGNNYGFYACNFTGYQDTVYANKGRELFAKSYIAGAVDFVFGSKAQAWFQSCDIETVGEGCIAANGRVDESNPSYYVFNNARVFGSSGNGSAYLGRPWRPYSRVVWQNSELGDVINPEGWQEWNHDNNTANVYFKEFNNRGSGAAIDKRVSFSGQLNGSVDIKEILGRNYTNEWFVDTTYL
ncbi:Pectin methylesterase [Phytophthora megakarya]|uniref:Pectinesterase n=1 Tax=Phytophthora megakarya TaxID=4795 RepID=A0A225W3I9_9STRA|nr:Pectin methylesterase [Phytophthora megakarya]